MLPIASLRGKGLMTELRMQDLHFSNDESLEFLHKSTGQQIEKSAAEDLVQRAEGWVTALRLAAIAMRWHDNSVRKLLETKGSTSYVIDYLIKEVLDKQSEGIRHLLLNTSILDRFCAPLCDAIYSGEKTFGKDKIGGQDFIKWLRNNNLFLISLDVEDRWVRYHHLFKDLLHRQLKLGTNTEEIAKVHIRASEWFESQGLITESIEHALAAGDYVHAAEIVERHRFAEQDNDRWYVLADWLDIFPAKIKDQRPGLLLTQAWNLFEEFRLEEMRPILHRIEQLLAGQTADSTLVGEVNLFQGYLSVWLDGDGERALKHLKEAKKRVPKTHKLIWAEIEITIALAYYITGKEEFAVKSLEEKINKTISSDYAMLVRLIAAQAFIFLYSSNLASAVRAARRWRSLAEEWHNDYLEAWAKYILANANFQSCRITDPLQGFAFAVEKRDLLHKRVAVDAFAGLILTFQFMGRTDDAMSTLEQMLRFAQDTGDPENINLAESCRARLSLLRGELEPAVFWARSFDEVNHMASMSFFIEIPSITQVKVLIATGTNDDLNRALESVRSLRRQAESLHFTCQTIELLILEAMALEQQGNTEEALEKLEEAVALAEPGGWIRPFVELGVPMADLLKKLRSQNVAVDYIEKILSAFSYKQAGSPSLPISPSPHPPVPSSPRPPVAKSPQSLVEPLTNRELEILEMLAQRLQNKEIAEKLFISPTTVKTHLQNIYQKLNAGNRREAVNNAKDLGIL